MHGQRDSVRILQFIVRHIEYVSECSGNIFRYIVPVLVFTITYDVFLRYAFNAPTKWSYDITYMLGGTLMLMVQAYTLLHKGHVNIDILQRRFSPRANLLVDTIFSLLLFFPLMLVLFYSSLRHAITSIALGELSNVGFWRPILYPFKTMIPIAFLLVTLQGIAAFIRNVYSLTHGGKEL